MQSQFEVEIGNEDIFDVFIFRRKLYLKRRSWSDHALKDVHEISDFFKFDYLFIQLFSAPATRRLYTSHAFVRPGLSREAIMK